LKLSNYDFKINIFTDENYKFEKKKIFILKMNEIKNQLNEIKLMQQAPKLYLGNYFTDLKAEVDSIYTLKPNAKNIYSKTIEDIELFANDVHNKSKSRIPNSTHCNEIELIEEQLNNDKINNSNIAQILKSLDELKYDFEKILFSNKTIVFLKDYGKYVTTFLLIIEDEYVRKRNIINESNVLTRDVLTFCYLKKQIDNFCKNASDVNKLDSNEITNHSFCSQNTLRVRFMPDNFKQSISPLNKFNFIKIDSKAFINLTNLKEIDYSRCVNDLNELHHKSFNGLINLKKIKFNHTKISKIHFNLFNGLDSLEEIDFSNNQIVEIQADTFSDLNSLKIINLNHNKINKINQNAFKNSIKLEELYLSQNGLNVLHNKVFNGLINLKNLGLSYNKITEIPNELFKDLKNLQLISLRKNFIETIHQDTFIGLKNLNNIILDGNKLKEIRLICENENVRVDNFLGQNKNKQNGLRVFISV
jgi:Leucine-rich repeat (LRR) protein